MTNYHRERTLGRFLPSLGLAVIRFHYSGDGNSQGDRQAMTFGSLCDDVRAVVDHATSNGFTDFALLGTRVGALVAAATARAIPSAPLAFWEPVTDPIRWITEAHRAKRISQLTQDGKDEVSDWRKDLKENGVLDLLGYDVHSPLVDSVADVDLLSLLGLHPRPIFIARFQGRAHETDSLAEELTDCGFPVRVRHFGVVESWWFDRETVSESNELITETAEWLNLVLEEAR